MNMQIGGLASGMDIDEMVDKLMEAERIPLAKMEQEQTTLTWKTDAFREVNTKLLDLDRMVSDMKYSSTYQSKSASSSQEDAVTATANSGAPEGSYNINVEQLASGEMRAGDSVKADIEFDAGDYKFYTYNEQGEAEPKDGHNVSIEEDDSLKDVLKKINVAGEGKVRASYDANSERVIMETTRTGIFNKDGNEITFDSNSLFKKLGLGDKIDVPAQDARFSYNGLEEVTSRDNQYTINDITFEFNNVTEGNARISVSNDTDEAFDKITDFVDQYNEVIDDMNTSQREEKFRDFPPLTEEQEGEMSEREIEQWEEKAKSGILRGESSIRNGMLKLRQSMMAKVDTDGEYNMLSQIGITQTKDYLDGGKLEVNEDQLKEALRNNAEDVQKLFSNSSEDSSERGIINRFDDALDQTKSQIESKAGRSYHTPESYSIGRQMKQVDERIETFERRMEKVETRYWNQFTAMEKAISELNQQADYMFSQLGGGEM